MFIQAEYERMITGYCRSCI